MIELLKSEGYDLEERREPQEIISASCFYIAGNYWYYIGGEPGSRQAKEIEEMAYGFCENSSVVEDSFMNLYKRLQEGMIEIDKRLPGTPHPEKIYKKLEKELCPESGNALIILYDYATKFKCHWNKKERAGSIVESGVTDCWFDENNPKQYPIPCGRAARHSGVDKLIQDLESWDKE